MSEKTPLLLACSSCAHVWVGYWFPMRAASIGRMAIRCPYCDATRKQIFIAGKDDIPRYREQLVAELARLDRKAVAALLRPDGSESP